MSAQRATSRILRLCEGQHGRAPASSDTGFGNDFVTQGPGDPRKRCRECKTYRHEPPRLAQGLSIEQNPRSQSLHLSDPPGWDACPDFTRWNVLKYHGAHADYRSGTIAPPAKVTPSAISSSWVINTCGIATTCAPIRNAVVTMAPASNTVPGPKTLPSGTEAAG